MVYSVLIRLVDSCFIYTNLLFCIMKVLGTPTREEIKCMNPNYTEFKFPQIKAHPWHKVMLNLGLFCNKLLSFLLFYKKQFLVWTLNYRYASS